MSKEQSGLANTSELGKTFGEQSGSARTHLDTVTVALNLTSKSTARRTNCMKFSAKISPI